MVTKTSLVRRQDSSLTIPLTTVFPRPTDCQNAVLSKSNGQPLYFDWGTTSDVTSAYKVGPQSCFPDHFYLNGSVPYFSPGVCPSGMTIAASTSFSEPELTKAHCCMPGASLVGDDQFCQRPTLDAVTMDDLGRRSVVSGQWVIAEPAVVIGWASSDLLSFDPPSPSMLMGSVSATATITSGDGTASATSASETSDATQPAPTANVQDTADTEDNGLSTGTTAGIGVGIALGILLLAALAIWAFFRRKKSKRQSQPPWQPSASPQWSPEPQYAYHSPGEMQNFSAAKYGDSPTFEMTSERHRAELHGS